MVAWPLTLALSLLAAAACGAEPTTPRTGVAPSVSPSPSGRDPGQRYEVIATVLESPENGPEICFGLVKDSLPPQCGGLPMTGFSWSDLDDEESVAGTTWRDEVRLVGTYDGTTFHLTQPAAPGARPAPTPFETPLPCPEPAGGWRVVDPTKITDENAAVSHARRQPDLSGVWLHWLEKPVGEEADYRKAALVLAFTGDLDRHEREARERWGGALCVTKARYTYAELDRARDRMHDEQARADAAEAGVFVYSSSVSETENLVELGVLVDDEVTRAWIEERARGIPVRIDGRLRPVR